MALTLLLLVLVVLVAYYFLGAPLLDFIHKFTKEFTHTFPLWSFFPSVLTARPARPGSYGPARSSGRSSTPSVPRH